MQTLTAPFTLWEIKSYLVNKHYFYDVNIQYTLFKMVHTLLKSNKRSIFNLCWVRHSNNKSCHSPLVSIVTPPNIFCFDFSLTSTFSFKSVVWPKGSWLPKLKNSYLKRMASLTSKLSKFLKNIPLFSLSLLKVKLTDKRLN